MDDIERERRLTEVFSLLVKRATYIGAPIAENKDKCSEISYNIVNIDLVV
ncbi:MAG TPA: hypothetical protein VFC84_03310 [Desulfosporosinus sp.]|nr:hypothetical protein [Desulfosporosinus sp.]